MLGKKHKDEGGNQPARLDVIFTQSKMDIENIEHEMPFGASDHCVLIFGYLVVMKVVARGREERRGKLFP